MAGSGAQSRRERDYGVGLARAGAGAVIFGVPLLMTMEMWHLGYSMDRGRLLVLMAANFVVLIGLSYFAGFEKTFSWWEDAVDAVVALGIGVAVSVTLLWIFAVLDSSMSSREIVGKVALQSVPASIGAMLGRKQLGADQDTDAEADRKQAAGYGGEVFLMLAGALYLAFNIAPTDEMVVIAHQMAPAQALILAAVSIALLHAFVYSLGLSGQEAPPEDRGPWGAFLAFTIVGYGLALVVSLFVLWTFGRTDGVSAPGIAMMSVVLGFPAALGAATARLVI